MAAVEASLSLALLRNNNNMDSTVRFLAFGLKLSVCQALVCLSPFKDILGVCLHFPAARFSWCDAQKYCLSVGGELVRGSNFLPLNGKSFSGKPFYSWIGMTDFLLERGTNRSGWRWSNGAVDPPSSQLAWKGGQPDNPKVDCVRQCWGSGEL